MTVPPASIDWKLYDPYSSTTTVTNQGTSAGFDGTWQLPRADVFSPRRHASNFVNDGVNESDRTNIFATGAPVTSGDSISIVFYGKMFNNGGAVKRREALNIGWENGTFKGIRLAESSANTSWQFTIGDGVTAVTASHDLSVSPSIGNGNYTMACLTYDAPTQTAKLYFGYIYCSGSYLGFTQEGIVLNSTYTSVGAPVFTDAKDLWVGTKPGNAVGNDFVGECEEILVWPGTVLSQAELQELWDDRHGTRLTLLANPHVHYAFRSDDISGVTITDLGRMGLTQTLSNVPSASLSSMGEQGITFGSMLTGSSTAKMVGTTRNESVTFLVSGKMGASGSARSFCQMGSSTTEGMSAYVGSNNRVGITYWDGSSGITGFIPVIVPEGTEFIARMSINDAGLSYTSNTSPARYTIWIQDSGTFSGYMLGLGQTNLATGSVFRLGTSHATNFTNPYNGVLYDLRYWRCLALEDPPLGSIPFVINFFPTDGSMNVYPSSTISFNINNQASPVATSSIRVDIASGTGYRLTLLATDFFDQYSGGTLVSVPPNGFAITLPHNPLWAEGSMFDVHVEAADSANSQNQVTSSFMFDVLADSPSIIKTSSSIKKGKIPFLKKLYPVKRSRPKLNTIGIDKTRRREIYPQVVRRQLNVVVVFRIEDGSGIDQSTLNINDGTQNVIVSGVFQAPFTGANSKLVSFPLGLDVSIGKDTKWSGEEIFRVEIDDLATPTNTSVEYFPFVGD